MFVLFIKYLEADQYQKEGFAICAHGSVKGQATPVLDVLDEGFSTEKEAIEYATEHRSELEAAHAEMEACMPSLKELNAQLVGKLIP
ncbi:MAG TPA: hypothetical protein VIY48_16220 [Candidatus Paceibacterota bacterium]